MQGKFPRTIEAARALMYVNLASAYCLQRQHEKARKCLEQVCSCFQSRKTIVLLINYYHSIL